MTALFPANEHAIDRVLRVGLGVALLALLADPCLGGASSASSASSRC